VKNFVIVKPSDPSSPVVFPSLEDGYEAYVKVEPEILALPPGDVVRVQADVTRCCAIALGAMPAIQSLKPLVQTELPAFPVDTIDKLTDYVFAAYYAHVIADAPARNVEKLQKLNEEAVPLREDLLVQAAALAHKGFFDAAKVEEIRGGSGYLDTANDLIGLSLMFRMNWPTVETKTTVVQAECERADQLGRDILIALGARLQPNGEPTTIEEAIDRRARAFTLFQRNYEACRKAAAYLRWDEGDADSLVPSLFIKSKSRKPVVEEPPADAGGGGATTPATGANGTPATPPAPNA